MLEKLKYFFDVNQKIKKDIFNMAPPFDEYGLSEKVIVEYWDRAFGTLKDTFDELKKVAVIFDDSGVFLKNIETLEVATMNRFSACGTDINKLKKFYLNKVANMSEELIDSIKMECFGYSVIDIPVESLSNVNSINEMLHLLHSFIVNNEEYYYDVEKISEKENKMGYPIILRGENTQLGQNLFNLYPLNLKCGYTDIVSLGDNKALIMVRDRGHALTIDIEEKNNDLEVNYFIPKIISPFLVNKLPGVDKIDPKKDNVTAGATGRFVIEDKANLKDLYDFIARVPADDDLGLYTTFKSVLPKIK